MGRPMATYVFMSAAALVALFFVVVIANTVHISPSRDLPSAVEPIPIESHAVAERLAASLRVPTVSHGPDAPVEAEALRNFHAVLERSFPRVYATLRREVVNQFSLLFTWQGSDSSLRPILLLAHMDVVPVEAETESDWTHPPFSGAIAEGQIWGRGALDDKSAVLATLEAVEYLLTQDFTPRRTVYLAFGHDEETRGRNGAARIAALLADRGVRFEFTLDEGSVVAHNLVPGVTRPVVLIGLAEKGYVSVELTATSAGGHPSMPPNPTAVGKLARAIHRLETQQMPAALRPPASEMFRHLAPEMPWTSRVLLANRWLFDPLILSRLEPSPATNALVRTTTAPTMVQGGVKENVLPSEARAVINFRILPGDSVSAVLKHVEATIADSEITMRQVAEGTDPSPVSDSNASGYAALRQTAYQVFPDATVAPSLVIAATDTKHYVKLADNCYRFRPMRLDRDDLKRIHGVNERISVENYVGMIRYYVQLLRNVAGPVER